jgi:hypothetical protein
MKKYINMILMTSLFLICFYAFFLQTNAIELNTYKTITNRNIIYVVEENNHFAYSWGFDKEYYKDGITFSLGIQNTSPLYKIIDKSIYDNIERQYVSFDYHGVLPSEASIKLKADDKFEDGEKLYLYYFNDETNRLEYIDDHLIVKNGFVEFKIKHCSDYILTGSIVKTAIGNPESMGMIIIVLIILGVVLVAATLFMNNKK